VLEGLGRGKGRVERGGSPLKRTGGMIDKKVGTQEGMMAKKKCHERPTGGRSGTLKGKAETFFPRKRKEL